MTFACEHCGSTHGLCSISECREPVTWTCACNGVWMNYITYCAMCGRDKPTATPLKITEEPTLD